MVDGSVVTGFVGVGSVVDSMVRGVVDEGSVVVAVDHCFWLSIHSTKLVVLDYLLKHETVSGVLQMRRIGSNKLVPGQVYG